MKPQTQAPPAPVDVDARMRAFVVEPVVPQPAATALRLRERTLDAMEARRVALQAKAPRHARRTVAIFAVGSCAAGILGVFSGVGIASWRARHAAPAIAEIVAVDGRAEVLHGGAVHAVGGAGTASLADDDELSTGEGSHARATLADGATIQIGASARLQFRRSRGQAGADAHDRIDLAAGKVELSVPKLPTGAELSVRTDDALVVVHGTRFSVERIATPGAPSATRVAVTEGRVVVLAGGHERVLSGGDALVVPEPPVPAPSVDAPAADTTPSPGAEPRASTLAKENALLAGAMAQRRRHHESRALALLDELLRSYPQSPLVETARVERLRLLEDDGDLGPLRRDAERYLADYPRGFARAEVTRMLATTSALSP